MLRKVTGFTLRLNTVQRKVILQAITTGRQSQKAGFHNNARIAGADLEDYVGKPSKLKDVDKNAYYAAAVNWSVEEGIISGYQNGNFGVGDSITREQIATVLYRYTGAHEIEYTELILERFSDRSRISGFAKDAFAWAVENKIINGMADGRAAPTEFASRAQIAVIIMNTDSQGMFKAD